MVLPKEMLMEIFSRLPAKSVGKFRSLSKTWRDSLSTREFIKSHLAHQKSRLEENLIFMDDDETTLRCTETIKRNTNVVVSRAINLPGDLNDHSCSCDGLVLTENEDGEVFLSNPITLEQVNIPQSPLDEEEEGAITYGLGYDSVRDDYKVAAFLGDMDDHPEEYDTGTYVYSVKTGVWKRLEISLHVCRSPYTDPGAFVNGAIHWIGNENVIVALDFANEVFLEFPLPMDLDSISYPILLVLGGCLCLKVSHDIFDEIWVMKDYGVAESWTKLSFCGHSFIPLCFIGDIEEVVILMSGSFFAYNVEEETSTELVPDVSPSDYLPLVSFVESLVSPALL